MVVTTICCSGFGPGQKSAAWCKSFNLFCNVSQCLYRFWNQTKCVISITALGVNESSTYGEQREFNWIEPRPPAFCSLMCFQFPEKLTFLKMTLCSMWPFLKSIFPFFVRCGPQTYSSTLIRAILFSLDNLATQTTVKIV